jgi:hypothetical protein
MPEAGDADLVRVTLTCRMKTGGGRVWIEGDTPPAHEPPDKVMIKGLQTAHRLAATMGEGGVLGQPETLVPDQAPDDAFDRKRVRLAFLAPDIQRALLEGRRPPGLTLKGVLNADMPPCWEDQRRMFGFPADGD